MWWARAAVIWREWRQVDGWAHQELRAVFREPGGDGRMSRGPWLRVTVDEAHGLALVRGGEVGRVAVLVSPDMPRWSRRGGGWVITASCGADVIAYAQVRHEFVVISHRGRRGDAA